MSDEIKVTASLQIDNTNFSMPKIGGTQLTFDQTNEGGMVPGTVKVGSGAEEDISMTELTTPGWLWMKNLDASNYVQWGGKTTAGAMTTIGRMEAGEPALFRLDPSATLRMQANTAECKVLILVAED